MNKEKKQLLVFGYGMAVILAFFATRIYLHDGLNWIDISLYFAAGIFLILTLFCQSFLKILYTLWMKLAHTIGGVITTLILSLLFYTIFGLVGVMLRILRKDLLEQKINRQKNSYWLPRPPKAFDKQYYQQQF